LARCQPQEVAAIREFLALAVIGGPHTVRQQLEDTIARTQVDELMLVCDVFDPALRLRALDIAMEAKTEPLEIA
jgi:alkanesulfonate monooxygenase SsuD/methylene tetrahydromethanopterin reductase-like flavin-dependent oxidoreductase (luciferase family)